MLSFCVNTVSLDWVRVGGDGVNCLLSSNDAVVANSNMIRTNMHGSFEAAAPEVMDEFYSDILTEFGQQSFLFGGLYIGAASTTQVSMSRVIEGRFDALFSIVSGPAIGPVSAGFEEIWNAVALTSNICGHPCVGDDPAAPTGTLVNSQNIVVFPDEAPIMSLSLDVFSGADTRVICIVGT